MGVAENKYRFTPAGKLGLRRKKAMQQALFDGFLPRLDAESTVVEVGPGRGEFAEACADRDLEFIGIEPSVVCAEKLRSEGFRIMCDSVPPITLSSNSVDLVHSSDFIEHLVNYKEAMEFMVESYRVLKPGGYFSVIAPNYETIKSLYFKYEYQHGFVVTRHRLLNMFQDSGFDISADRSFLLTVAPGWNRLDRIIAHTALPVLTAGPIQALIRLLSSEKFLFKINKNLYDHVAVLGQKPIGETS